MSAAVGHDLDSLIERLRESRGRSIIEPMLAGETLGEVSEDDRRFTVDRGLVRQSEAGGLEVANPIYRDVIVRTLAGGATDSLPQIRSRAVSAKAASPIRISGRISDDLR